MLVNESLHQFLGMLPIAGYTCDSEGLITYYNQRAADLWGRAPAIKDPADRYSGSWRISRPDGTPVDHAESWMARAVKERCATDGDEFIVERPDGWRRNVRAYARPLTGPAGEPAGAVGMLIEITDRKEAEESMRRTQQLLHGILDHFPGFISAKDLQGRVILVNRRFDILKGPSHEEFWGKNVYELFPKEIADTLWNNDLAAQRTGMPIEAEETVEHKDGAMHTYHTIKFPLFDENGKIFGTGAISFDKARPTAT